MPHSTNTPQSTMQQGEDQRTVAQRIPTSSSASPSRNAVQENEEGLMINAWEPQAPALSANEGFQAKSSGSQDSPQDL